MNELNIYYHIVPINDGYVYLCQEQSTGELYLWHKAHDENPEALIFSSEQAAEEWIKLARLPRERFKPEWFATAYTVEKFADMRCDYGKM